MNVNVVFSLSSPKDKVIGLQCSGGLIVGFSVGIGTSFQSDDDKIMGYNPEFVSSMESGYLMLAIGLYFFYLNIAVDSSKVL